jgi:FtsP/CotA-like multicopper oxidase with cupredoxin domain
VINGPASANYDIDLGSFPIADWYYSGIDSDLLRVENPNNPYVPGFPGSPPTSDNVMFNGTNINPNGTGGSYAKITLQPGKLHRLRFINPSVENTFSVSLVGHNFTVISTDFVAVQPTTVPSIYMTVGQRYDVIINASQPVDNYWLNVTYQTGPCGTTHNPAPAAIVSYSGAPNTNPTTPGTKPADASCADSLSWTPVVTRTAPVSSFSPYGGDTFNTNIQINASIARVFWPVNNSPMNVSWGKPTLEYVRQGTVSSMPSSENVVSVPNANVVSVAFRLCKQVWS